MLLSLSAIFTNLQGYREKKGFPQQRAGQTPGIFWLRGDFGSLVPRGGVSHRLGADELQASPTACWAAPAGFQELVSRCHPHFGENLAGRRLCWQQDGEGRDGMSWLMAARPAGARREGTRGETSTSISGQPMHQLMCLILTHLRRAEGREAVPREPRHCSEVELRERNPALHKTAFVRPGNPLRGEGAAQGHPADRP